MNLHKSNKLRSNSLIPPEHLSPLSPTYSSLSPSINPSIDVKEVKKGRNGASFLTRKLSLHGKQLLHKAFSLQDNFVFNFSPLSPTLLQPKPGKGLKFDDKEIEFVEHEDEEEEETGSGSRSTRSSRSGKKGKFVKVKRNNLFNVLEDSTSESETSSDVSEDERKRERRKIPKEAKIALNRRVQRLAEEDEFDSDSTWQTTPKKEKKFKKKENRSPVEKPSENINKSEKKVMRFDPDYDDLSDLAYMEQSVKGGRKVGKNKKSNHFKEKQQRDFQISRRNLQRERNA